MLRLLYPDGVTHDDATLAHGSIDEINGSCTPLPGGSEPGGTIPGNGPLFVCGWAFVDSPRYTGGAVLIAIDGRFAAELVITERRDDVANVVSPTRRYTGFSATLPSHDLHPGDHEISVIFISRDATTFVVGPTASVLIVNANLALTIATPPGSDAFIEIDGFGSLAFDQLDDGVLPALALGEIASVHGWAYDKAIGAPCSGVYAQVDGRDLIRGRVSHRPDVVTAYGNPGLLPTGFAIDIDARLIGPGKHRIAVLALSGSGTTYTASPSFDINVS